LTNVPAGKTASEKYCIIPFLFNNSQSYFCALNRSQFICAVDSLNFDSCNLGEHLNKKFDVLIITNFYTSGEFLRVRTNSAGDAFTLPVDFETPINTIPGVKYTISMYSLINCQKTSCSSAQDRISVQIKEGINGNYKEMYVVKDRNRDTRWIQDSFSFHAADEILFVSLLIKV
jgi:hypothetical protein